MKSEAFGAVKFLGMHQALDDCSGILLETYSDFPLDNHVSASVENGSNTGAECRTGNL